MFENIENGQDIESKVTITDPNTVTESTESNSDLDVDALFDSILQEATFDSIVKEATSDDTTVTEGPEIPDDNGTDDNGTGEVATEGDEETIVDDVATAVDDADDGDFDPEDDDDEFDPDDLSDEELLALDKELSDEEADAIVGDEAEVTLSPEEEVEADDMMNVAATAMLVKDELSVEERVAFLKNEEEVNIAINEGFLTEADVNEMSVELGLAEDVVTEAKYNNRMIIKLDAASKKKQLYALAVNVSAAAHNDRDYIKLKKVMKARKILRLKLAKKYHGEATKRMKIYFKRLNASKSGTLNSIGKK